MTPLLVLEQRTYALVCSTVSGGWCVTCLCAVLIVICLDSSYPYLSLLLIVAQSLPHRSHWWGHAWCGKSLHGSCTCCCPIQMPAWGPPALVLKTIYQKPQSHDWHLLCRSLPDSPGGTCCRTSHIIVGHPATCHLYPAVLHIIADDLCNSPDSQHV